MMEGMSQPETTEQRRDLIGRGRWGTFLAAPVIYTLYFLLSYFFVEITCELGLLQFTLAGLSAITVVVLVLTLLALGLLLYTGFRIYRSRRNENVSAARPGQESVRFMVDGGFLLTLLFVLLTALSGVVVWMLSPCEWI